jgi:glycosyltransferase involved in cell wall biosynthesis
MKIALVHDYLNQYGGAERVLQVLCAMFPQAPIYTAVYDEVTTGGVFKGRDIRTSFLQNIPGARRFHHAFSFLMPIAFEQFDFSSYDVVLSISSSFGKGIITKPATRHICYCLTPPRYLWDDAQKYVQEFRYPALLQRLIPPFLSYLRVWDKEASLRPDIFVAISQFVQERITKYYGRESPVLYPPVNAAKFRVTDRVGDYFLMVGRLVSYKKFDVAIRVFNDLGWPLKIVGTGIEMAHLKEIAKPNIEFMGAVTDDELAKLYAGTQALIFPQEEDFGIVPLEAMASGRPVIAYRGGGAVETIIEGSTGIFFNEQNEDLLRQSIEAFDPTQFSSTACRARALEFDIVRFQEQFHTILL